MNDQIIYDFMTFHQFSKKKEVQQLNIDSKDLYTIYSLLDHNRYVLSNEHYLPVFINAIKKKTSISTGQKIESLFKNDYKIFLNV